MSDIKITNPILKLLPRDVQLALLNSGDAILPPSMFSLSEDDRMPIALIRCKCPAYYLIAEIDPYDPDVALCLYDDSVCVPTFDTVSFEAMYESLEGEVDHYEYVKDFKPTMTMLQYLRAARKRGSVAKLFAQLL